MFLYYKVLHKKALEEVDNYYSVVNPTEYIDEHTTTDEKLDYIYEMMNDEMVKDTMYPLTSECETNRICLDNPCRYIIPFDKIKILVDDNKYYVTDDNNNKIVLDTTSDQIDFTRLIFSNSANVWINPFYIIDCIYEWERFPLNELSTKCLPYHSGIMSDGQGQIHSHSRTIIQNIIYPRYLHYKTIRH